MQHSDRAGEFLFIWKVYGTLIQPEAEYPFDKHLGRKHRFDFAFPDYKVAVEVEGNAWGAPGGGKHMMDRDLEKYNIAATLGWLLLRFSPTMLRKDPETCVKQVIQAMETRSRK